MDYKLYWSEESIANLQEILNDLESKWTVKEVNQFKKSLEHHLSLITKNPNLFPVFQKEPRLRKAVLSKQTTVFYEIKSNLILLAYVHLNKMDDNRIK